MSFLLVASSSPSLRFNLLDDTIVNIDVGMDHGLPITHEDPHEHHILLWLTQAIDHSATMHFMLAAHLFESV